MTTYKRIISQIKMRQPVIAQQRKELLASLLKLAGEQSRSNAPTQVSEMDVAFGNWYPRQILWQNATDKLFSH